MVKQPKEDESTKRMKNMTTATTSGKLRLRSVSLLC